MKKLNIGCGPDIRSKSEGWVNLDDLKLKGVDVVHSLNKFPYPFKNNEFDEVFCSHILEHVDDLIKVMKELHRITKPNGIIKIHVPHFSCGVNYRDPIYERFFCWILPSSEVIAELKVVK